MDFAFGYWKTKGEKSFEVLSQWVTKLAQIFQSILEHFFYFVEPILKKNILLFTL